MGRPAGGVGVMGMTDHVAREAAMGWVERTCAAQGLCPKVTDLEAIRTVVALIGQTRQTGSTRSGSKRVRPRTAGRTIARSRMAATIAR